EDEEPVTTIILPETQSKNEMQEETKLEETEFITSVEEQPKKLVDGSDFLPMTDPNLKIFEEENKEEKEKESKTHHSFSINFFVSKTTTNNTVSFNFAAAGAAAKTTGSAHG
ncbi:hypothetical protein A2U01_0054515, partial [Trifolium medium]|nr:hypothetical protein [Trifolium medium]